MKPQRSLFHRRNTWLIAAGSVVLIVLVAATVALALRVVKPELLTIKKSTDTNQVASAADLNKQAIELVQQHKLQEAIAKYKQTEASYKAENNTVAAADAALQIQLLEKQLAAPNTATQRPALFGAPASGQK